MNMPTAASQRAGVVDFEIGGAAGSVVSDEFGGERVSAGADRGRDRQAMTWSWR
jgi:hypothetical protein